MPNRHQAAVARLAHRRDLPRPLALSVNRAREVVLRMPDVDAFEAWRQALIGTGPVKTSRAWRHCTGWATSAAGERVRVTIAVGPTKGSGR